MIEASSSANRFKESDNLMLITNKGQMVRTRVKEIRETGRNTMGVKYGSPQR
jgi:DNA gyrase/topoisomerase IV subunit A